MKKYKILAVVFAVLTGISVLFFFSALQNSTKKNYVEVVVAAKQIEKQTVLTPAMLKTEKLPSEAVHPDAARSISGIVGRITDESLEKGEVILRSKLIKSGSGSGGFSYKVPKGMRATTIKVDNVSGVGGLLKAGDKVDVIAEFEMASKQSPEKVPTSLMLLENITVLAIGTDSSSSTSGTYTTVTLSVSPGDALKLNLAATSGKIRLALRQPLDKDSSSYPSVTTGNLS